MSLGPWELLPRSFFLPPPDQVARGLLGKLLVRRWAGGLLAGRIVETEAYFSEGDPAAHAAAGRTPRNQVLWGEPGHAYVYFIYGMHACLNVACEPAGEAGCVLLRAVEPQEGMAEMARLRGLSTEMAAQTLDPPVRLAGSPAPRAGSLAQRAMLTSGPGRLCQAFGITREGCNGVDLLHPAGELLLASDGVALGPEQVAVTPRIGISKAAERPLRFLVAGNAYVSGPRGHTWKRPALPSRGDRSGSS